MDKKTDRISKFLEKIEKMKSLGIDVSKIKKEDTIFTIATRYNISEKVLNDVGLLRDDNIGPVLNNIINVCEKKIYGTLPTEEQIDQLKELGINLDIKEGEVNDARLISRKLKKDKKIEIPKGPWYVEDFIAILETLKEIDSSINMMDIGGKDTLLLFAKKHNISKETLIKKGLEDIYYPIGKVRIKIGKVYRGKLKVKPEDEITEEQMDKLKKLGVHFNKKQKTELTKNEAYFERLFNIGSTKKDSEQEPKELPPVKECDKEYEELSTEIEKIRGQEKGGITTR